MVFQGSHAPLEAPRGTTLWTGGGCEALDWIRLRLVQKASPLSTKVPSNLTEQYIYLYFILIDGLYFQLFELPEYHR